MSPPLILMPLLPERGSREVLVALKSDSKDDPVPPSAPLLERDSRVVLVDLVLFAILGRAWKVVLVLFRWDKGSAVVLVVSEPTWEPLMSSLPFPFAKGDDVVLVASKSG